MIVLLSAKFQMYLLVVYQISVEDFGFMPKSFSRHIFVLDFRCINSDITEACTVGKDYCVSIVNPPYKRKEADQAFSGKHNTAKNKHHTTQVRQALNCIIISFVSYQVLVVSYQLSVISNKARNPEHSSPEPLNPKPLSRNALQHIHPASLTSPYPFQGQNLMCSARPLRLPYKNIYPLREPIL